MTRDHTKHTPRILLSPNSFAFCLAPHCVSQGKVCYGGYCGRHAKKGTR